MPVEDIIILVEEPSAAEIVRSAVRQLGYFGRVKILKHQGFGDLKKSIKNKIASDPFPNSKFLILCDADDNDCKKMKRALLQEVPARKRSLTIIRIVCRELEAWYLAQPDALRASGSLAKSFPASFKSKNPDEITDPKGVFLGIAHQKGQIAHARAIGPHLDPNQAKSASFRHFITALHKLAAI